MQTGCEGGALLVDGLGDGIAVSCPSQDLNFLRNMSFGVLQGSRMRNTKTGDLISLYCFQLRCTPRQLLQSCYVHLHSVRLAHKDRLAQVL